MIIGKKRMVITKKREGFKRKCKCKYQIQVQNAQKGGW